MIDGLNLAIPFPFHYGQEMFNGSMLEWPEYCVDRCNTKRCLLSDTEINICGNGYNYFKVDDFIFGGLLLKNYKHTKARGKLIKSGNVIIPNILVYNLQSNLISFNDKMESDIEKHKAQLIDEYSSQEMFKIDFLKDLKKEIIKGLSFVHDYKQINSTIHQNINVIIEEKYSGSNIQEKMRKATVEEVAIYKASSILVEKLNVAKFLLNPEWLLDSSLCSSSQFYKMVNKYVKLYENKAKEKNIKININGQSFNRIIANSQAISVIPHTLIDNAIKYSSKNSEINIVVNDMDNTVLFSVISYGPKILEKEKDLVFHAFYRGENAIKIEEEGAGYGLYVCQLIAIQHLNSRLILDQSNSAKDKWGHKTTFSIVLPDKATVCDY